MSPNLTFNFFKFNHTWEQYSTRSWVELIPIQLELNIFKQFYLYSIQTKLTVRTVTRLLGMKSFCIVLVPHARLHMCPLQQCLSDQWSQSQGRLQELVLIASHSHCFGCPFITTEKPQKTEHVLNSDRQPFKTAVSPRAIWTYPRASSKIKTNNPFEIRERIFNHQ